MKKIVLLTMLFILLTAKIFAQDTTDNNNVSYQNIQIYMVYQHPDSYVIMYYEDAMGLGQLTIPIEWFKPETDKAILRTMSGNFTPYMVLQYTGGVFSKVIVTMPANRNNPAWGLMPESVDSEAGSQADTLILE